MRSIFVAAVLTAALGVAQAQTAATPAPSTVKPLVGFGVTFGGKTIEKGTYSDGESWRISSGGLIHFYAGAEFAINNDFALQATLGYHFDRVNGSNGNVRFTRMPLDFTGLYKVSPQVRLGGGIQHVSAPKLAVNGVAGIPERKYEASTALVLEGEYLISPTLGTKVRFVNHEFKNKATNVKTDGAHVGVMLSYYF